MLRCYIPVLWSEAHKLSSLSWAISWAICLKWCKNYTTTNLHILSDHFPCPTLQACSSPKGAAVAREKGGDFLSTTAYLTAALHSPEEAKRKKGEGRVGIWEYGEFSKEGKWHRLLFFPKVTLFLRRDILLLRFKWTQQPSFVVSFASAKSFIRGGLRNDRHSDELQRFQSSWLSDCCFCLLIH